MRLGKFMTCLDKTMFVQKYCLDTLTKLIRALYTCIRVHALCMYMYMYIDTCTTYSEKICGLHGTLTCTTIVLKLNQSMCTCTYMYIIHVHVAYRSVDLKRPPGLHLKRWSGDCQLENLPGFCASFFCFAQCVTSSSTQNSEPCSMQHRDSMPLPSLRHYPRKDSHCTYSPKCVCLLLKS